MTNKTLGRIRVCIDPHCEAVFHNCLRGETKCLDCETRTVAINQETYENKFKNSPIQYDMRTKKHFMQEEALVLQAFLESCYGKIACGSLDMHAPTKSVAETFVWRKKVWIVVMGASKSNNLGTSSVGIRAVVPSTLWDRPFNDINKRVSNYYLGGRFKRRGKGNDVWVITDTEMTLRLDPDAPPPPEQKELF